MGLANIRHQIFASLKHIFMLIFAVTLKINFKACTIHFQLCEFCYLYKGICLNKNLHSFW
jgi:hypothetical protein